MPPLPAKPALNPPHLLLPSISTPRPLPCTHNRRQRSENRPRRLSSAAASTYPVGPSASLRALCSGRQLSTHEDAYVEWFRLCERYGAVDTGTDLYARADEHHSWFSLRLGNAMLCMLVKFGEMWHASRVFAKMPQRDVFSWTVMVQGYGKAGFLEEALESYHRMLWARMSPNGYTFTSVLWSCKEARDWMMGRELHAHVVRFGFADKVVVLNALIAFYAKCGDVVAARKIFDSMTLTDCVSWNAMIAGHFENDECKAGLELFLIMLRDEVQPNLRTITSVTVISGLLSDTGFAKAVHGLAVKRGFATDMAFCPSVIQMYASLGIMGPAEAVFSRMDTKDVTSWTTMISGYEKNCFPDKALEVYHNMLWAGISPNAYTFTSALRSCWGLLDCRMGREVHAHVLRFGFVDEVAILNALITMYAKCGDVVAARKIFDNMTLTDCVSWNAMIAGHFENDECKAGLELFLTMLQDEVQPNLRTITSVTVASGLLSDTGFAKAVHGLSVKRGFATDVAFCPSVIQMYASLGMMGQAEAVFSRMDTKDVRSWTTMISGYEKNCFPDKALEVYHKMLWAGISPNAYTFTSVLRSCWGLRDWRMGREVHAHVLRFGFADEVTILKALITMYAKCEDVAFDWFQLWMVL